MERSQYEAKAHRSTGAPMTAPQAKYLKVLCDRVGEDFDPSLSKAAAMQRIDDLKRKTRPERAD